MKKISTILKSALMVSAFLSGVAKADVVESDFNIGLNSFMSTAEFVPSVGRIKLELNSDGTIDVSLTTTLSGIRYVGFDSSVHYTSAPPSPYLDGGISNGSGVFNSAIFTFDTPTSNSLQWTIGAPNEFASVNQLFDGANSIYDFYLFGTQSSSSVYMEFGSIVGFTPSNIPEPTSIALLAFSLAGLGAARLRKAK